MILIEKQRQPRALITDFGFSNATRRANVAYSKSYGNTDGYVSSNNTTPWDPSNDVYAFGVTFCQVCSDSAAEECFSECGTLFRLSWWASGRISALSPTISTLVYLNYQCNRLFLKVPTEVLARTHAVNDSSKSYKGSSFQRSRHLPSFKRFLTLLRTLVTFGHARLTMLLTYSRGQLRQNSCILLLSPLVMTPLPRNELPFPVITD